MLTMIRNRKINNIAHSSITLLVGVHVRIIFLCFDLEIIRCVRGRDGLRIYWCSDLCIALFYLFPVYLKNSQCLSTQPVQNLYQSLQPNLSHGKRICSHGRQETLPVSITPRSIPTRFIRKVSFLIFSGILIEYIILLLPDGGIFCSQSQILPIPSGERSITYSLLF